MTLGELKRYAFQYLFMMELLAIGKNIGPRVPQKFFERGQLDHVAAFELDIFLFVEFTVKKFDKPFVFYRVRIMHLEQGFHVKVSNLDERIVQCTEHIKNLIPRAVLSREKTVSLEEHWSTYSGRWAISKTNC